MRNAEQIVTEYREFLIKEEKSEETVKKYTSLAKKFLDFAKEAPITKELTLAYKEKLKSEYEPTSVNNKLSALNGFLHFLDKPECCVKTLKIQQEIFCEPERELREKDAAKLLRAAAGTKYSYIIQCFYETGIRVSELSYITVEAVKRGHATVYGKNKFREVFLSEKLCKKLKAYCKEQQIKQGSIFVTRTGRPLCRSAVWKGLKKLCAVAGVDPQRVFPHNFRHLFARMFYAVAKDISMLADLLGHSSLQTTRIYIKRSGAEHRKCLEEMVKRIKRLRNNDSVAHFGNRSSDPLLY